MRFFRFIKLRAKISLQQLLIYRLASLMTVLFGLLFLIAEYLAIDVYYTFSDDIVGWNKNAFLILFGSFNCILCIYNFLFEIGHDEFIFKLKYGELDYDLLRPMDPMILSSISRLDYPSLLGMILPSLLIYYGVKGEGIELSFLKFMFFVFAILSGALVVYLLHQILVISAFWLRDFVNAFQFLNILIHFGSKPLKIYPWFIQVLFGFLLPVILAGNLPAKVLFGVCSLQELGSFVLALLFLSVCTRLFWKAGLRKYSSASS